MTNTYYMLINKQTNRIVGHSPHSYDANHLYCIPVQNVIVKKFNRNEINAYNPETNEFYFGEEDIVSKEVIADPTINDIKQEINNIVETQAVIMLGLTDIFEKINDLEIIEDGDN